MFYTLHSQNYFTLPQTLVRDLVMAHPCQQLVFSDYSIVVILGDHELVSEYGVGHSRVFFGEMSSQDLPKFFSVLSFNSQSADSFLIY